MAQARAATPDFAMSAQQEAFRSVADEFMAAATAGDKIRAARMLSPAIVAKPGPRASSASWRARCCRSSASSRSVGSSISVSRTADVTGFVFYMYMVSKTGELRPFVIYVIEEGGAKVVANVLVDQFVESRHCPRVAGGLEVPGFQLTGPRLGPPALWNQLSADREACSTGPPPLDGEGLGVG